MDVLSSNFFHFGFILLVFLIDGKVIIFVVLLGIFFESLKRFFELLLFLFFFCLNISLVLSKILLKFFEFKLGVTELDFQSFGFRYVFRGSISRMKLESEVFGVLGKVEMGRELDAIFLEVGEDL